MYLADQLTFDAPKRTRDGYLAVRARAARAGIYEYLASEVGAPDTFKATDTIRVYRSESEVFDRKSVASFQAKPITNDHPNVSVTSDNWKDVSSGVVMGALRDGEYLAFDLVLMDGKAIADVEAGKRELSNAYTCELVWGDGVTPDGKAYDARQINIIGNHVALVDKGRAGSECAIKDAFAACEANQAVIDSIKKENVMKITIDGLQVDLSDADAVKAVIAKVTESADAAKKELADSVKAIDALKAEKAVLEKQLADAKGELEPAAIEKRVADRAALVESAKVLDSKLITDGKSDADIRSEIVTASLGDIAKDYTADQFAAAFAVLAKSKPAEKVHDVRGIVANDQQARIEMLKANRVAYLSNAHRGAA